MIKTLLFYDLELIKNEQTSLFSTDNSSLQKKVEKFYESHTDDEMLYISKEDSVLIQLEELTPEYIFGSYGRFENLEDSRLTRARDRQDFDLQDLEDLIESYTYFYLNLNTNEIVLLNNSRITGFKTNFSKFISTHFRVSTLYKNIAVVNKLSDDIDYKIGQATSLTSIKYSYTSENLPSNDFLSAEELFELKNNQIKSARIHLVLDPDENYTENVRKIAEADKSQFDGLTIETKDEVIDAIEKTLSKKVSIEIDEESFNQLANIKEMLADNLS